MSQAMIEHRRAGGMDRLRREYGRAILGAGCLIASVVFLIVGYTSIRSEIYVAIMLPDVLWSGVGAVLLAVVGVGLLRSGDEAAIMRRIGEMEDTNHELAEKVGYLTQLLELAILPDDADVPIATPQPEAAH
jgi:multidrug transporter EmrE-like cation transporter